MSPSLLGLNIQINVPEFPLRHTFVGFDSPVHQTTPGPLTGSRVHASQIKDCSLPILGDVFFIVLILWGSFFTLNLLLAVLEGNFTKGKEDEKVDNPARVA